MLLWLAVNGIIAMSIIGIGFWFFMKSLGLFDRGERLAGSVFVGIALAFTPGLMFYVMYFS